MKILKTIEHQGIKSFANSAVIWLIPTLDTCYVWVCGQPCVPNFRLHKSHQLGFPWGQLGVLCLTVNRDHDETLLASS